MSTDFWQKSKGNVGEQRQSFQKMVWEPLHTHTHTHTHTHESRHRPYTFHKNELKIDHKPKYKTQTINVKK